MNPLERLDILVLAFMLSYALVLVIRICYHYHSLPHARMIENACQTPGRLATNLSAELAKLNLIAFVAPYLGLGGTCIGILRIFTGFGMARHAVLEMLLSKTAAAILATPVGIVVAVFATCSHNFFRSRIRLLGCRISRGSGNVAQSLPLANRFSAVPFPVIAAPALAMIVVAFVALPPSHRSMGLSVRLLAAGALENELMVEPVVVSIREASSNAEPAIYVNSRKIPLERLDDLLRDKVNGRLQPIVNVEAAETIRWAEVAAVIDIVKHLPAEVALVPEPTLGHLQESSKKKR